jgi:hypothetical protein
MCLHEFSRSISLDWPIKVDGQEYERLVRECFDNRCPYCHQSLVETTAVIEHLDGMNRYRAGLHVPGNVLVACGKCNSEKRRDDAKKTLSIAASGWESFLSHNGTHCDASCRTCQYWEKQWGDQSERNIQLNESLERIRQFRSRFSEFQSVLPDLIETLPVMLTKLYSDCQSFAENEIKMLLETFKQTSIKPLKKSEVHERTPRGAKAQQIMRILRHD